MRLLLKKKASKNNSGCEGGTQTRDKEPTNKQVTDVARQKEETFGFSILDDETGGRSTQRTNNACGHHIRSSNEFQLAPVSRKRGSHNHATHTERGGRGTMAVKWSILVGTGHVSGLHP